MQGGPCRIQAASSRESGWWSRASRARSSARSSCGPCAAGRTRPSCPATWRQDISASERSRKPNRASGCGRLRANMRLRVVGVWWTSFDPFRFDFVFKSNEFGGRDRGLLTFRCFLLRLGFGAFTNQKIRWGGTWASAKWLVGWSRWTRIPKLRRGSVGQDPSLSGLERVGVWGDCKEISRKARVPYRKQGKGGYAGLHDFCLAAKRIIHLWHWRSFTSPPKKGSLLLPKRASIADLCQRVQIPALLSVAIVHLPQIRVRVCSPVYSESRVNTWMCDQVSKLSVT